MSTYVPPLTFGPNGFTQVAEVDILNGRLADFQAAFGGDLNPALNTPQGQIASSEAAIIADANSAFLGTANGVDPAVASGRLQDAIGRIYFQERIPAVSTVVTAMCVGQVGTKIPAGSQMQAQDGNIYASTQTVFIQPGGSVSVTFACLVTGAIACPAGYLNRVYRAIAGLDAVYNSSAGVLGRDVESRADFEFRREQSVAMNSMGSLPAIRGAVLAVGGVLDAFTDENGLSTTNGATFTGSIAGYTLTVTGASGELIALGNMVTGPGVPDGVIISSFVTGLGSNGTYYVNHPQTVASATMHATKFGVVLAPKSLYVAAYGGDAQAVAQAIWTKKAPGCAYNGNTTATVLDMGNGYHAPYPSYDVTFNIPTPTPILLAIVMQTNVGVPSNAVALVRQAVTDSFTGADGGQRARIGTALFAGRFYANIANLGGWAQVFSILIGTAAPTLPSIQLRGDQVPTITDANIAVSFVS